MHGIYTYIPDTKYVPREYRVAAILLLLFMVLISLVSVLNLLYFYTSTFRSMCAVPNMAVFCLLLLLLLLLLLFECCVFFVRLKLSSYNNNNNNTYYYYYYYYYYYELSFNLTENTQHSNYKESC